MKRVSYVMLALIALVAEAGASAPARINLQGVLRDDMGGLEDGVFSFKVQIFPAAMSTTAILNETYASTPVQSGIFSLEVGGQTANLAAALAAATGAEIEISVDGVALPRQPLSSAAYALHAQTAVSAEHVPWSGVTSLPAACGGAQFLQGFASGVPVCATPTDTGVTEVTNGGGVTGSVSGTTLTLGSDSTIQRRSVANSIACTTANTVLRSVTADGTATCYAVPQGTVTSIATGAGLTGGSPAITSTGTIAVDSAVVAMKNGSADQSFDSGTLYIDFANNRVGILDSSPSEALDVDGNADIGGNVIATGDYTYRSPKSGHFAVSGSAFVGAGALRDADEDGYRYCSSCSGGGSADVPVNLPDGATVTALRCYYYDNDPTWTITVLGGSLRKRSVTSPTVTDMAVTGIANPSGSLNSGAIQEINDSTITAPVINNDDVHWIRIIFNTSGTGSSSLRFYGCRVDYTLTTVAF